jgi:hypothetical protein
MHSSSSRCSGPSAPAPSPGAAGRAAAAAALPFAAWPDCPAAAPDCTPPAACTPGPESCAAAAGPPSPLGVGPPLLGAGPPPLVVAVAGSGPGPAPASAPRAEGLGATSWLTSSGSAAPSRAHTCPGLGESRQGARVWGHSNWRRLGAAASGPRFSSGFRFWHGQCRGFARGATVARRARAPVFLEPPCVADAETGCPKESDGVQAGWRHRVARPLAARFTCPAPHLAPLACAWLRMWRAGCHQKGLPER